MLAEKAKENHRKEKEKTHEVDRPFLKNSFNNVKRPTGQVNPILLPLQKECIEQKTERKFLLLEETEDTEEGFFMCPNCTCWFNNQKDLNHHLNKWCDRQDKQKLFFSPV
jgi:hypothetical protein